MKKVIENFYNRAYKKVLKDKVFENNKVCDIGFGYGSTGEIILDEGAFFYGLEPRKDAYEYAVKKYNSSELYNDILNTEFAEKYCDFFDLILCFTTLEQVDDKNTFLFFVKKMIKKNGRILISVRNGNSIYKKINGNKNNDLTHEEWVKLFISCNLKPVNITAFKRPLIHELSFNGLKQLAINITEFIVPMRYKYLLTYDLKTVDSK
jgi:2-polyprenyl-3-methyl-5-hydroxy-6-metoxy-1,4-benzoquinol methylase